MSRALPATLLFLLSIATSTTTLGRPPVDPRAALEGLDAVIEQALTDQKIPGASVGVVVGDEVVLLKGYGLRDVDGKLPMTPDTIQQVASITKQFTVSALGTLVRRGKLEWDKPVREYLPDFKLDDDYATLHATPRDLVTHRIGLPRHDMVWVGATLTREQLYQRLQHLPFSRDIRTQFQYNNFMYMTAGYLGGKVNGTDWETLVRTALFEPLGMKRSMFSLAQVQADADHARGYTLDNQRRVVPQPFESCEAMGPTGTICSTARDMTHYMRMMLAGGEFEGRRVLDAADVRAMMQPITPIGAGLFEEIGFRSYGMGLFIETYRGHELAGHGGNLSGAAAMVTFAPKEKIGIVVLTNRTAGRLRDGLPREILDRLLGLPSANMIARFAELETKSLAGEEAAKSAGVSDRKPNTHPSHELAEYAGRYSEPAYGDIDVTLEDGKLWMAYHGFKAALEHWHYDVFQTPSEKTSDLDEVRVQFETDLQGEIAALAVPFEPSVEPIAFRRTAPPEMLKREFLQQFVGVYEIGGIDLEVRVREDGVLQTVQLGRAQDLEPLRGMTFRVKGSASTTVEFLKNAAGQVDRIAFHSGGSTIGPRKR